MHSSATTASHCDHRWQLRPPPATPTTTGHSGHRGLLEEANYDESEGEEGEGHAPLDSLEVDYTHMNEDD